VSVKELRRKAAMRRMLEGTVATLTGGLILWLVTIPLSQPASLSQLGSLSQSIPLPPPMSPSQPVAPSAERPDDKAALSISAAAAPSSPSPPPAETRKYPALSARANFSAPAPIPGSATTTSLPMTAALPYSIPVGSILLYENFSHYRDGDVTDWGQNTSVRTGLDRRKWLVPNVDGTHPVGRKLRLPQEFYLECRYSAGMSDVTRGLLGWWKEPISGKVSFLNDQGVKYVIEWAIGCGNDTTRLNPLGSPSLYPKKYYHTIKLPGGAANEVGVLQPTGTLRISRESGSIKVSLDGQVAAAGTIAPLGQLVGFEINVVKTKNGTLSFTDFKIAR
jgi:hypothetical protein